MKNRFFALALVFCMLLAMAVIPAHAETGEKVKIRLVYWNEEKTMKAFLDLAQEKLPHIELEYQFIPVDQIDGTINTQLQAGEGPDILHNGHSVPAIKAGYLLPLDDQEFINNYSKESIDALRVDGKIYGVPGVGWYEGMFFNKEIFEKYGLTPPKTFAELMNIHKVLKENGVKPQAMGANSWEPMMKSTLGLAVCDWLMKTEEGKQFDYSIKEGTGKFEGSALKGIIETWSQYIKDGYITPDMLEVSYDNALVEFASGKAAMWESGPWAVAAIKETNPDLKFDMFPFVGTEEGESWLIGGSGVTFGVNASSKHSKEALEVLALMATQEGQIALLKGSEGSNSYLKGVQMELPEFYASAAETLNANRVYCPWFIWGDGNGAYIETYGKGLQEYLQNAKDIDTVLREVDEKVFAEHAQQ